MVLLLPRQLCTKFSICIWCVSLMLVLVGLGVALGVISTAADRATAIDQQIDQFLSHWQAQLLPCVVADARVFVAVPVCVRLLACNNSLEQRLSVSVHDAADALIDLYCDADRRIAANSSISNSTDNVRRRIDHLLVPPSFETSNNASFAVLDSMNDLDDLLAFPWLHLLDDADDLVSLQHHDADDLRLERFIVIGVIVAWFVVFCCFVVLVCMRISSKEAQQEDYRLRVDEVIEELWGRNNTADQDGIGSEDGVESLELMHADAEQRVAELLMLSASGVVDAAPNADGIRKLIIAGRANLRARDFRGEVPLQIAIHRGHFPLAKLLIKHGAPTRNALHWAIEESSYLRSVAPEWILYLAQQGARLDVENDKQQTVIHAALDRKAVDWPHASVVHALASLGALDLDVPVMAHGDRLNRSRARPMSIAELAARRVNLFRHNVHTRPRLTDNVIEVFRVVLAICEETPEVRSLLANLNWQRLDKSVQAARFQNYNSMQFGIAAVRWKYVRRRMTTICVAMWQLQISALEMLAVCDEAVRFAELYPMHLKWDVVVAVKHFQATAAPAAKAKKKKTAASRARGKSREHRKSKRRTAPTIDI